MFPPYDAPLTSGQRQLLLVLTLFFPILLFVYVAAVLWFRDTHPQRASSITGVGRTYVGAVLLVVMFMAVLQIVLGRLRGF